MDHCAWLYITHLRQLVIDRRANIAITPVAPERGSKMLTLILMSLLMICFEYDM